MQVVNDLNIRLYDNVMETFVQKLMLIDELEINSEAELTLVNVMAYKLIQNNVDNFHQQDVLQKIVNCLVHSVKQLMLSNR